VDEAAKGPTPDNVDEGDREARLHAWLTDPEGRVEMKTHAWVIAQINNSASFERHLDELRDSIVSKMEANEGDDDNQDQLSDEINECLEEVGIGFIEPAILAVDGLAGMMVACCMRQSASFDAAAESRASFEGPLSLLFGPLWGGRAPADKKPAKDLREAKSEAPSNSNPFLESSDEGSGSTQGGDDSPAGGSLMDRVMDIVGDCFDLVMPAIEKQVYR
jgi:hypothetical protein